MRFSQPSNEPNLFIAVFDGDCHTCGGDIFEGDEAGYFPGDTGPSCPDCIKENRS